MTGVLKHDLDVNYECSITFKYYDRAIHKFTLTMIFKRDCLISPMIFEKIFISIKLTETKVI